MTTEPTPTPSTDAACETTTAAAAERPDPDREYDKALHQVKHEDLTEDTMQTSGMRRREAISGKSVGSSEIWMGETIVPPTTGSGNHHHGHSETGIYVVSGHPEFVFLDGDEETRLATKPGDFVFVPPFVPHREENPDPADEAVVVIARSTQEAIVVNLDDLVWVGPVAVGQRSPDQQTWHEYEQAARDAHTAHTHDDGPGHDHEHGHEHSHDHGRHGHQH